MKLWPRGRRAGDANASTASAEPEWSRSSADRVEASHVDDAPSAPLGRGRPHVQRVRSLEMRMGNGLALALFGLMAAGLLSWYFVHTWSKPGLAHASEPMQAAAQAQGEMRLPPLSIPLRPVPPMPPKARAAKPDLPKVDLMTSTGGASHFGAPLHPSRPRARKLRRVTARAERLSLRRALSGPVFVGSAPEVRAGRARAPAEIASNSAAPSSPPTGPTPFVASAMEGASSAAAIAASYVPRTSARRLSALDLLLPKGASLDCTLETAIDSTLPGLATCVMPHDVFGASGRVVLLERGTQLVGQTRSDVHAGQARLYVLWTSARTPEGVVVNLDSQGIDPLGRAGLPGTVEHKWRERFGAAVMLSVLQGAIAAGVASQEKSGSSSVVISPQGPADLLTQALRQSAAIPPRIVKAQGDRIAILVERNIDFRSVYRLIHTSVRK